MLGYKKGNKKLLTGQIPLHYPGDRVYLDGDPTKTVQDKCARKADLTNLDLTGTTNTTGSAISSGTYFYLNGTLVRAKTAIASGATFTENTNYEVATVGDAIERGSVSITADGVKTRTQLLDSLHALMDTSKITNDSKIAISSDIHTLCSKSGNTMRFSSNISMDSSQSTISHILFRQSESENIRCICNNGSTNTINNISSTILSAGTTITLYY